MVKTRAFLAFPALLLIVACSTSTPSNDTASATASPATNDPAADNAAVTKAHAVLEGAFRTSDCNAMVSNAASDAVLEPPNSPSATGPDGIRAWCTPMFTQMKTKALTASNTNYDLSGDIAVDHGDYDWTLSPAKGGADVHSKGRYVVIWHRQSDGSWKWTRQIWNSSEPMPKA